MSIRAPGDVLQVDGDLDDRFGPIDTGGAVRIAGGVRPNLSLSAGGSVEIGIQAQGDVTILGEAVGPDTRVVSQAGLTIACVRDAEVVARGDVDAGRVAGRSRLTAGGRLVVREGGLPKGEASATRGISIAGPAGSPGTEGPLVVISRDPEIRTRLDKVHEGLDFCEKDIGRILRTLGMRSVSRAEVEAMFQRTPTAKRKFVLQILKHLEQLAALKEDLVARQSACTRESDTLLADARIEVTGVAYSGTRLRIGEQHLDLGQNLEAPVFRLDPSGIRW
jgi:uncharacterized protein (DUF342 family)